MNGTSFCVATRKRSHRDSGNKSNLKQPTEGKSSKYFCDIRFCDILPFILTRCKARFWVTVSLTIGLSISSGKPSLCIF